MTFAAGRMAPSPTGGLHPGHARTFLMAWLAARQRAAPILLRVEDIDATRCRPEFIPGILADLAWLGLHHDGPAMVQSTRLEAHAWALETLRREELAYPCSCTRSDILRAASAPHAGEPGQSRYPGTCAWRSAADAATLDTPFCWRFRMPASLPAHSELVGGAAVALSGPHPGDPIIWRADRPGQPGGPAYHLAVVVDDAFQGVGEIVRGADLLEATPVHRALQEALGLPAPSYAHVPLLVDHLGQRLSKRDGATKLAAIRAAGTPPEALLGHLAHGIGLIDGDRPVKASELIGSLDWKLL